MSFTNPRMRKKSQVKLGILLTLAFGVLLLVLWSFWLYDSDLQLQNPMLLSELYEERLPTIIAPPQQCTARQLSIVEQQLPAGDCVAHQHRPWTNKCSFSYATRCPDAIWLEEEQEAQYESARRGTVKGESPIVSIYVGCNKGMDAVDTLRRTSRDPMIDRSLWKDAMLQDTDHERGRCQQEHAPQSPIAGPARKAVVHCIEAMPITARKLQASAESLGWKDRLMVYNIAVSQTDGTILFPNADIVGVENLGMDQCDSQKAKTRGFQCKEVPSYRLDTFAQKYLVKSPGQAVPIIDFISIDVEGYDFAVLMGSTEILKKTRYIEFEYNWKGPWKSHLLSDAVSTLQEASMVCYWAGTNGYAWRITDCWQESYDLKFWSNVACAHVELAPHRLARLEKAFQNTLRLEDKIKYDAEETNNSDGG